MNVNVLLPLIVAILLTGCSPNEAQGDGEPDTATADTGEAPNDTSDDSGSKDSGDTEEEDEQPVTVEDCAAISDDEACLSACVLACVGCAGVAIGDSNCDTMFYGGGSYWKYSACETCVSLIDILDPYCPEASVEFAESA